MNHVTFDFLQNNQNKMKGKLVKDELPFSSFTSFISSFLLEEVLSFLLKFEWIMKS